MTVKELIKQLQKMPQKAKVVYHCGDNGWCEINCTEYCTELRYVYGNGTYKTGGFVIVSVD